MKKLSVIMPCFNEQGTIRDIVAKVLAADRHELDIELIIVDDGSRDNSREIIAELRESDDRIKPIFHERNRGKGAALRAGVDVPHVEEALLDPQLHDPQLLDLLSEGGAEDGEALAHAQVVGPRPVAPTVAGV